MRTKGTGAMLVRAAAAMALAGVGMAASVPPDRPDPHVVYTCVTKHGEIAILGPRDACKSDETPQQWSLQAPTGEQGAHGVPGRVAAVEALNGRPCTTPGGPAGMIIETRYYGTRSAPTLRCRVPGGALH